MLEKIVVTTSTGRKSEVLSPYIRQFRGKHNADPESEDENNVKSMLVEWVAENKEEYDRHGDKAIHQGYKHEGGHPDQLIMNPRAYEALQNALGHR